MNQQDDVIRVLLLESHPEASLGLQAQLNALGSAYAVEAAESLAEGLQMLRDRTFDVALTDLASHGSSVVARVRQESHRLAVIAISNVDDEATESELLSLGAQDFLVKDETNDRRLARSIKIAVQRQRGMNTLRDLVIQLEEGHQQLARQTKSLRDANRLLRKQHKTSQEFVGHISHDFRTPLTVIKDYISIISDGLVGPVKEEQQDLLDKASIRADDLNTMVDDLLDASKLESGQVGAWRRDLPAADLLCKTDASLRERAKIAGVDLSIEFDDSLPDVCCDPAKLDRVVMNLAIIAIKSAGPDGSVGIRVESDPVESQVVVSVSDTGPGIEPELLDTMTKHLAQPAGQVKLMLQGYGVGLNIAQQFCQLNLGELSVASRPGSGSTFSFSVPVADSSEVLTRWLDRSCDPSLGLQLYEIGVEESAEKRLDCFLSCHARASDLLLRVSSERWMLLLTASQEDGEEWLTQAKQGYAKHNRHRPAGSISELQICRRASWDGSIEASRVVEDFESLVANFSNPISSEPLSCATVETSAEDQ